MEHLSIHLHCPRQRPRRQRGDIMLVTMVFLLVCLLGLVVSMREGIVSTLMNGNNLARQRDVQVSDIVTRQAEGLIGSPTAPLAVSAYTQPWMRIGPVVQVFAAPTASYWDSCLGNSDSTLRCGSIVPTVGTNALGYTTLLVVQWTGRNDPWSCQAVDSPGTRKIAFYYDVFVHVKEANGVTSSDTHTVYRLCI
jgi:Tfp pilus assembly protein PilX